MMEEGDDGARVGLWVTLGIITLLLFGLLGGLAMRQMHKAAPASGPAATADADAMVDGPLSGELLGKLYFDVGVAAVPADAAATLSAVQAALGKAGSGKLVLAGFHDASGDPAKNAILAKDRAKAVRAALTSAGVDAARIALRKPESTAGDGKPEEARRVEIRLLP